MKIDILDIQYFLENCKYQNNLTSKEFQLVEKYAKTNFRESFEEFLIQNKYESSNLVYRIKDAVMGYKNFMKGMQTIKHKSWGY